MWSHSNYGFQEDISQHIAAFFQINKEITFEIIFHNNDSLFKAPVKCLTDFRYSIGDNYCNYEINICIYTQAEKRFRSFMFWLQAQGFSPVI
jgi:hypothetical protein